jgi:hypothetical protein
MLGALMHQPLQALGGAHQQQADIGMARQKLAAGHQRHVGAVVAPHAINSQSDHRQEIRRARWPNTKKDRHCGSHKQQRPELQK